MEWNKKKGKRGKRCKRTILLIRWGFGTCPIISVWLHFLVRFIRLFILRFNLFDSWICCTRWTIIRRNGGSGRRMKHAWQAYLWKCGVAELIDSSVELRDSQPANWIVRRGCFCSIPIEEIRRCDNKRIRSNAQTISIYDIIVSLFLQTFFLRDNDLTP